MALIPKINNRKIVGDFQDISLCNVSYQVISKILANRIKVVLCNLVDKEQCGFITGYNPLDNILAI